MSSPPPLRHPSTVINFYLIITNFIWIISRLTVMVVLGWPWRFVYARGPVFDKVSVQFDWTLKGFQLWGIKSYFFSLYNTIEEKSVCITLDKIFGEIVIYLQLTQKEHKVRYFSNYLAPNRFTLKITRFTYVCKQTPHSPAVVWLVPQKKQSLSKWLPFHKRHKGIFLSGTHFFFKSE